MADSFIGDDGIEYVVLKNNPFPGMSDEDIEDMKRDGAEMLGFEFGDNDELIDVLCRKPEHAEPECPYYGGGSFTERFKRGSGGMLGR